MREVARRNGGWRVKREASANGGGDSSIKSRILLNAVMENDANAELQAARSTDGIGRF